jgi:hypothetical protein
LSTQHSSRVTLFVQNWGMIRISLKHRGPFSMTHKTLDTSQSKLRDALLTLRPPSSLPLLHNSLSFCICVLSEWTSTHLLNFTTSHQTIIIEWHFQLWTVVVLCLLYWRKRELKAGNMMVLVLWRTKSWSLRMSRPHICCLKADVHPSFIFICCLLWIDKVRGKDKTYIWVSVWWKTKNESEEFTRLTYTGLIGGLEHLKIETRLIDEKFANVMGEYVT